MRTHIDHKAGQHGYRLTGLQSKAAELERELAATQMALDIERQEAAYAAAAAPDHSGAAGPAPEARTERLLSAGRASAYNRGLSRQCKIAIACAVIAALITILVLRLVSGGASWPPSVATVQSEIVTACKLPDVQSEPDQVDFACAPATRQVLWVFALLTSGDNPGFADTATGRVGLEPITPAEGGELAWSLNLHHPYDAANPIDSLEVAARAINNIIGGATLTGPNGLPLVQPGLEGNRQNCARYTGSAAITLRQGFPSLCARPVTSPAGQAALVADVYKRWVVGATRRAAQDAAVLFVDANDPANPQVQAILRQLPR